MSSSLRWGFVGAGWAARLFAEGLRTVPGSVPVAVASRRPGRAAAFARELGVPRAHDTAAALVADPEVDVVYVASPHALHRDHALLALEAGKAVLVEKPFACDARQAADVVAAAERTGRFCMEALWTRFLPCVDEILDRIAAGVIGRPRLLVADFGIPVGPEDEARFFDPAIGGGALLDLAPYPVFWATQIFGRPERVVAGAVVDAASRVDDTVAASLVFAGGEVASFVVSLRLETSHAATIYGTEGRIEIPKPFYGPRSAVVVRYRRAADSTEPALEREEIFAGATGNGYGHQAEEVARCLERGDRESPLWPLRRSLLQTELLDELRNQIQG